jgi:hypothetical protein
MAEKMVDRIGRMLRTTLLQSQLPPEFWGAAVILATDVYNCTPHSALNNQSPFYCSEGVHPDLSFFRPFSCSMVVHRGKDLVEHHKLAPRGEKCVYLGCGNAYGRRAYIAYSPRLHRVFSTIHAEFDETFFPFRTVDQRVRGRNDNAAQLETLSLYHDMPNDTITDITERIKSNSVPCTTEWSLNDLMRLPATMHPLTPNSGDSGDGAHASSSDQSAGSDYDSLGNINNVTLRKLKESVFVHDRPEPYASLPQSWKAVGKKMTGEVSNTELAEC